MGTEWERARRRIWIETRRELGRPKTLHLAMAYIVLSAGLALFFGSGRHFEWYLRAVYLFLPLPLVVLGAHVVLRDHRRGFSFVVATTPLRGIEVMAAKVLFLLLFLVGTLGVTLLTTLTLTGLRPYDGPKAILGHAVDAGHALRALEYFWLGLCVGLFSGVLGLLVGHVVTRLPKKSPLVPYLMGLGGLAWFGLAALTTFVALRPQGGQSLQGVLELSPLAIAFDALDASPETRIVDDVTKVNLEWPIRLVLLVGAALLLVVGLVAASRPQGDKVRRGWIVAGVFGGILMLGAVGSTAAFGATDPTVNEGLLPVAGLGDLVVRSVVDVAGNADRPLTLAGAGRVNVTLLFEGRPGAAYRVEEVCVHSRGLALARSASLLDEPGANCVRLDRDVTLDGQGRGRTDALPFFARVDAPDGSLAALGVIAKVVPREVVGLADGLSPIRLSNPIGIAEAGGTVGKPTRLLAVFLVATAQPLLAWGAWRLVRRERA